MVYEKDSYISPSAETVSLMPGQNVLQASGTMHGENAGDEDNPGF